MSGRGTKQNSGLFSPLFGLLLFTISVVLKFKGCYLFVEIARIPQVALQWSVMFLLCLLVYKMQMDSTELTTSRFACDVFGAHLVRKLSTSQPQLKHITRFLTDSYQHGHNLFAQRFPKLCTRFGKKMGQQCLLRNVEIG